MAYTNDNPDNHASGSGKKTDGADGAFKNAAERLADAGARAKNSGLKAFDSISRGLSSLSREKKIVIITLASFLVCLIAVVASIASVSRRKRGDISRLTSGVSSAASSVEAVQAAPQQAVTDGVVNHSSAIQRDGAGKDRDSLGAGVSSAALPSAEAESASAPLGVTSASLGSAEAKSASAALGAASAALGSAEAESASAALGAASVSLGSAEVETASAAISAVKTETVSAAQTDAAFSADSGFPVAREGVAFLEFEGNADASGGGIGSVDKSAATEAATSSERIANETGEILDVGGSASSALSLASAVASSSEDASVSASASGSSVPLSKIKYTEYTVQAGDSVKSIAESFALRPQTVIQVNALRTVYPEAGTVLRIPSMDGRTYTVQGGDTVFSVVQKLGLSIGWSTLRALNGLESDALVEGEELFVPYADMTDRDFSAMQAASGSVFISPLHGAGVFASFSARTADPLTHESTELDGVLLQSLGTADVFAAAPGSVVDRGFNENGTYFVKLSHKDGYTTYYNYLTWCRVKVGDRIQAGDSLGTISSDNTLLAQPTLFFRIEQDGIALDPSSFFKI